MSSRVDVRKDLFALRETIAKLEEGHDLARVKSGAMASQALAGLSARRGKSGWQAAPSAMSLSSLSFGIEGLDQALGGGLCLSGMTEIRHDETRESGTASGFVLGLVAMVQRLKPQQPVLWIFEQQAGQEGGLPYGLGLAAYGVKTGQLFFSCLPRRVDALWLAETALSAPIFSAIILELRGNHEDFGLTEGRRLQVRAKAQNTALLLLRQAGQAETGAAPFRLHVKPALAGQRCFRAQPTLSQPSFEGALGPQAPHSAPRYFLPNSLGNPAFAVCVEKSRTALSFQTLVEWSFHEHRFFRPDHESAQNRAAFDAGKTRTSVVDPLSLSANRQGESSEMGRVLAFR